MTVSTLRGVLAAAATTLLLAGCSGSALSGSTTTTTPGVGQSDASGRLTSSLSFQNGELIVEPAPAGEVPTVTSDDAIKAAGSTPPYGDHVPTVVFGLGTTPHSGQAKSGGGFAPTVDHQLVWIVWYSGVDIGHGGACCGTIPEGPNLGDSITVFDAQTGRLLLGLSGPSQS